MKTTTSIFKVAFAIVICEIAGMIGTYFTIPSIQSWYATLVQPHFAPPNWIFAPVWTILFALMGIALAIIWIKTSKSQDYKIAIQVFCAQLLLNIFWSIIFFGLHSPRGALVEMISLWLMILATIISFKRISVPAAYLLLPYILWVSFAFVLNFNIWLMN